MAKAKESIVEIDRSSRGGRTTPRKRRRKTGKHRYIAVSGNIGSGKSSLVEFLCRRYEITPFFEPHEENPYLADFYDDMKRWSFASQVYFLSAKFRMHSSLEAHPRSVIQDRTIWEDAEIFAENLHRQRIMSERDYRTYRQLYEAVRDQLRAPDLMIYLRCPVRAVRKRITARGREIEQGVPTSYLRRLHDLYEEWIADYRLSPLVILPTEQLDYVTDLVDCHDVLSTIEKYLP
jgi:deoxyadenosine/deoxycytidine kinase